MLSLGNKLTLNSVQPTYHFVNKYSIVFDGVDDCIITDGADTVAQPTTYSFWCKSSLATENTVFGHGGNSIGRFGLNSGNAPILHLGGSVYQYWVDIPQQDDGEWHHWVLYADTNTITNSQLYCDGVLQNKGISNTGTAAGYTESLTIGGTKAVGGSYFVGNIDEFATFDRELTQEEITRMYNTYYSPNRVANGNFSQIGNEEVENGDFSQIGSELVTNGDFSTDSDWTLGTGATISNNLLNFDNVNNDETRQLNLFPTPSLGTYEVSFDISNYVGGHIDLYLGGYQRFDFNANSNGTWKQTCVISNPSSNNIFYFIGDNFTGSIDNVSVKEVGQDWTLGGTDWSIGDSKLIGVNAITETSQQILPTTIARNLKISFDIVVDSGSIAVYMTDESKNWITSSTSIIKYVNSSSKTLEIDGRNSDPFNGSVTNISVKEVGQGWTLGAGWTIAGGIASQSGGVGQLYQTISTTVGVDCKITFTANVTAGAIRIAAGPGAAIADFTSGTHTLIVPFLGNTTLYILGSSASFVGSIDNIVVQELKHDATNLMLNAGAYQSANPLITSTNSMEFDGVDDFLSVADADNLSFVAKKQTFCAWIYPKGVNNYGSILQKPSEYQWYVGTGNIKQRLYIQGGSGSLQANSNTFLEQNKWNYCVATYDGTNIVFYLNGVADGGGAVSNTITASTNPIFIGENSATTENLDGNITELGMYDRVLTSLEVASLYNQGMPTNLLVNRNDYQSGNPTVFNTKQVDFDGVDDYLRVEDNSSLDFVAGFSVSYWVYPQAADSNDRMVCKGTTGSGNWMISFAGGQAIRVYAQDDNGQTADFSSSNTLTLNEWAMVTVVINRTTNYVQVYKNGGNLTEGAATWTGGFNTSIPLTMGVNSSLAGDFEGQMSQVGIFNSELTADEVSSLYNHGLPVDLNTNQAAYTSSSNLVGYWRMGSGTLDSYPVIFDQTNATLGSELVVNGDFATDSDWVKGTGWTISGGSANCDGTQTAYSTIKQIGVTPINTLYKMVLTVTITSGNIIPSVGGSNGQGQISVSGTYTFYTIATTGDNSLYFGASSDFDGSIDNVSVKEVNGNPAIMTNQTASDIKNGSPYANLVQNGTFATDTDWVKEGTWTISNGTANRTAQASGFELKQTFSVFNSNTWKVSFEIISISNGGCGFRLNGGSVNTYYTEVGVYTETIIASGAASDVIIQANSTFAGSIDNVTVEEVNTGLQGYWKMGSGINDEYPVIADQVTPDLSSEHITGFTNGTTYPFTTFTTSGNNITSAIVSSAFAGTASNAISVTSGEIYKVTFDYTKNSGDDLRVVFSSQVSGAGSQISNNELISASGSYIKYFTITSTTTGYLQMGTGNSGHSLDVSITNISAKNYQGNPATMTNMVEGNITNQYPLTKIRNYYRMGDGILDKFPIIQDQTSPNLAHIPTTNSFPYSEDFTNSDWNKADVSVTPNSTTSPQGTTNASLIKENSANALHFISDSMSVTSGNSYTVSVFAKKKERNVLQIVLSTNFLAASYANYNLTTGVVSATGGAVTAKILSLSNDWYKCEITFTSDNTISGSPLFALQDSDTAARAASYTGDGTSGLYLWGAQFEEQSQATAYLPSYGVASVRKATTTNTLPNSEYFDSWSSFSNVILTAGQTSPDNNTNAYKLIPNTVNAVHSLKQYTVTGQTFSVTAKKGEYKNILLWNDANSKGLGVNLDDNSIFRNVGVLHYNITELTDDWKRIDVTLDTSFTGTAAFYIYDNSTPPNITFAGNDSDGLFIYAAQLEEQTQAETYAPTYGLPVTIDLFTENNYGTMINMTAGDIVPDTPNN